MEYIDLNNLDSSEWTVENTPFSLYGQCITEYPDNRFLLIGGTTTYPNFVTQTWILDPKSSEKGTQRWVQGKNLKQKRYLSGCFSIKGDDDTITDIYVAGGHCKWCGDYLASTEVLNLEVP